MQDWSGLSYVHCIIIDCFVLNPDSQEILIVFIVHDSEEGLCVFVGLVEQSKIVID